MSAYLPTADSGHTCCDCARAAPCDDCTSGCGTCDTVTTGRCELCKTCLGPHNTYDCGFGSFDSGWTCIDGLTECSCNAYVAQGYSIAFFPGESCAGADPCTTFGGCAHTGLGACCDEACDCLSGISEADCISFGGTCWNEDCLCLGEGYPFGCGVCYDSCDTGACCYDDSGTCSVTTYSACIGGGGYYVGDGTTCPNAVCNPCSR